MQSCVLAGEIRRRIHVLTPEHPEPLPNTDSLYHSRTPEHSLYHNTLSAHVHILAPVLAIPRIPGPLDQPVVAVRQSSRDRRTLREMQRGADTISPVALTSLLRLDQQHENGLSHKGTMKCSPNFTWKHTVSNIGIVSIVRTKKQSRCRTPRAD